MILFHYYLKDFFVRLKAHPVKSLTKFFLSALLGGVALVILLTFFVTAKSLEARLERMGANSIIIRETASRKTNDIQQYEFYQHLENLKSHGSTYSVKKFELYAHTESGRWPSIYAFESDQVSVELYSSIGENSLVYFDEDLKTGTKLKVWINNLPFVATVMDAPEWFERLSAKSSLLAPIQFFSQFGPLKSAFRLSVFEKTSEQISIQDLSDSLLVLKEFEERNDVHIKSPNRLLKEQDELNEQQMLWRLVIVFLFGTSISLLLGSMAVFEYQESQFTSALLRSFGVRPIFLYLQALAENFVLLNLGALSALLVLFYVWRSMFLSLGYSLEVLEQVSVLEFYQLEALVVFVFVNIGALLSSVPFYMGSIRDVGRVLE